MVRKVTVKVPATSANLGPGFDCLGLALGLYNTLTIVERPQGLKIEVQGEGADTLPVDQSNLVIQAARRLFLHAGKQSLDLHIVQNNRIPVSSGLGSSASAVVGGLVGANALLDSPFAPFELLRMASEIEGHPDNVAPALFGDLVLTIGEVDELIVEQIPLPKMLVVIVLPDHELSTHEARRVLPDLVPREDAIFNISRASLLVRALAMGNYGQLSVAVQDRLHQPYRLALIPGMVNAFEAAKGAGAAAVALSGAGPSLIAFAQRDHDEIKKAVVDAFEESGLSSRSWVLPIDKNGTEVSLEKY
jgi:homoserine kinase